jgi:hypothetical protein
MQFVIAFHIHMSPFKDNLTNHFNLQKQFTKHKPKLTWTQHQYTLAYKTIFKL